MGVAVGTAAVSPVLTPGRALVGNLAVNPSTSTESNSTQPPALVVSSVRERVPAIDAVRALALLGVVFVHACESDALLPWRELARFTVPFYLFAALYFQCASARRNPQWSMAAYMWGRVHRLLMPFVAWGLFYMVARNIKRAVISGKPVVGFDWSLTWTGSAYHLWFLPFLIVVSLVTAGVLALLARRPRVRAVSRWPVIAVFTLSGLVIAFTPMPRGWSHDFEGATYAWHQWWQAAPAACWAVAFAWLMTMGRSERRGATKLAGSLGIVAAVVSMGWMVAHGMQLLPRAISGLGLAVFALAPWRGPVISALGRFGRLGYGMYLSHVFVVELARVGARAARLAPGPALDLLITLIGVTGALAVAFTLSRWRRLAWLNG